MSRLVDVRVPVEPLLQALGSPGKTDTQIAVRLGVTLAVISAWRNRGLALYYADEIAIGAGLHPSHVWVYWHRLADRTVTT